MNGDVELDTGWQIRALETGGPLTAGRIDELETDQSTAWMAVPKMPMQIHDFLLARGDIDSPWLPGGVEATAWIARSNWVYRLAFPADPNYAACYLRLLGLDTVVEIVLNGRRIARHDNQYLPVELDVTTLLRESNTLLLYFPSVFDHIAQTKVPPELEGRVLPRQMLRKMSNDFADYLGPKPCFARVGVFRSIVLHCCSGPDISSLRVRSSLSENLDSGSAAVEVQGRGHGVGGVLHVSLLSPDGEEVAADSRRIAPDAGTWKESVALEVRGPELWWPRGHGGQPLYRIEASLSRGEEVLASESRTIGFRTVHMERPFHFIVNGVRVWLHGAALAPIDLVSLCWNGPRAAALLDWAELSHMNTLRVWAEIGPVDDELYRECDRRGFLVWQDFQTNGPLPDTPEYVEVFRKEAEHYVSSLQHHPSILLWCGGNENFMWHFRRQGEDMYSGSAPDCGAYPGFRILTETFPEVCRRLDPERFYFPSTPYLGRFPNDPTEGTSHGYSHVWFVPGGSLPNFTAEDTRICPYEEKSLRRFMAGEDLWPEGYIDQRTYGRSYPYPDSWVRHTSNEGWRKVGPVERFYDAHDVESLVYRMGAANESYYGELIDRCRRAEGRNGGYLYWRLNDAWPMHFSAKIDYFLEPTRSYYAIRRSFVPVRISTDIGDEIGIWVCNDARAEVRGTLIVELFNPELNRVVRRTERSVKVPAGESRKILQLDEFGMFRREHLVASRLVDDLGQPLDRDVKLLENERSLTFPDATITLSRAPGGIELSTDRYARCVQLSGDDNGDEFGWMFEDNYFDLLPGDRKQVRILGRHASGIVSAKPFYSKNRTSMDYLAAD